MPFLHGPMAWSHYGPLTAKYTPPKVLKSLAEAIAIAFQPWRPTPTHQHQATLFVDAAKGPERYVAAMWSTTHGTRIWHLPNWVNTQQAAELAAIEHTLKLAAYEKLKQVHIIADNMAAIFTTTKFGSKLCNPTRARHVRRIAHTLRWSKIQAQISWIRSRFNPADCPSRYWKYPSMLCMQIDAHATYEAMQACQAGKTTSIGWASHRSI